MSTLSRRTTHIQTNTLSCFCFFSNKLYRTSLLRNKQTYNDFAALSCFNCCLFNILAPVLYLILYSIDFFLSPSIVETQFFCFDSFIRSYDVVLNPQILFRFFVVQLTFFSLTLTFSLSYFSFSAANTYLRKEGSRLNGHSVQR